MKPEFNLRTALACVLASAFWMVSAATVFSRDFHVATTGDDAADGSSANPLRTIQAAADRAQPGDVITVREGVYRERIDPPRGGRSDASRIVYQAAPGGKVTIKGSEPVKGWEKLAHDTWRVKLSNKRFGGFNPYADEIKGDWFNSKGRKHHTGAVYLNGHWLTEAATLDEVVKPAGKNPLWFATVDDENTTITAQFPATDPNLEGIEINVRQAVFYPRATGCNFITVRGFTLEHAATNWAPPTAEQVGLIGTHWSKGWIIDHNTIRYSTCTGVTLGKHGDEFDNKSANSAEGYVETIKRGLAAGWSKENIGHHVVSNNHVSHCEQAGIVGSLGAVFSTITGNEIHDIHVRELFGGAEQAGIKIHAAIDTLIARNHIHHTVRGIWLDWMAQGTHVTRNLLHDNPTSEDLFVEVNHGPFLVDHNFFLSKRNLADWSEGGAYAHNLFAGKVVARPEPGRQTPWQEEHGTKIAGLMSIKGGDNRFFNNIFIASAGLDTYDQSARPNRMEGNVFLKGAKPSLHEKSPRVDPDFDPDLKLREEQGAWFLEMNSGWSGDASGVLVTSELLGKTEVSGMGYLKPDGSPYRLDRDFTGTARRETTPSSGPFEARAADRLSIRIWPPQGRD
jgi:alpha-L-arabinofuranosidase